MSQASTIVLAILLTPTDFGVFGVAMIVLTFAAIPGDLGLTIALVQMRDIETSFPTALRLRWAIAGILLTGVILSSPLVGIVLVVPSAVALVAALSLIFPGAALGFGPRLLLTRELKFRSIALADLIGKVTGPLTAIALAARGFGYWSLVAGFLASQWAVSSALLIIKPVAYRGRFNLGTARKLLSFGKYVSISTLLGYLLSTMDNVVVVYVFGVTALGLYGLAYSFSVTIPRNVASMVETVTFPIFSKISDNTPRLTKGYLTTFRFVSYLAFPMAVALVVFSSLFADQVLGTVWHPAGVQMSILGLAGLFYALSVPTSALLYACAKPRSISVSMGAGAAALVLSLTAATLYASLETVAIAAVAGAGTYFAVLLLQARKAISVSLKSVLGAASQAFVASVAGGVVAFAILLAMGPSITTLVVGVVVDVVSYIAASQAVSRGAFLQSIRDLAGLIVH